MSTNIHNNNTRSLGIREKAYGARRTRKRSERKGVAELAAIRIRAISTPSPPCNDK